MSSVSLDKARQISAPKPFWSRVGAQLSSVLAAAGMASLAACGGSDGGAGNGTGTGAASATTTFLAYAQANPAPSGSPVTLSESERGEVASRTRQWAAETLITRDTSFPANAVAIPPLYFGRTITVGAAASGTTLAALLAVVPAPSTPGVAAGMLRGLSRQIRSGQGTVVTTLFMDAVLAKGFPDTFANLTLTPLSAGELAAEPNLRLAISDTYAASLVWPQAVSFDGVFERDDGSRHLAPMLRVTGTVRSVADATMDAVALELPGGRHLIRITPTTPLSAWSTDALVQAIAVVTGAATGSGAVGGVTGDLVLPALSGFGSRGGDDLRGMSEATNPVLANLRGMDGLGGNYADLPSGSASLVISSVGMAVNGTATASFIFSPANVNNASGVIVSNGPFFGFSVSCGSADLRPSYLALINALGGVEMLARFSIVGEGSACSS